jgi:hypothetical protein
MWSRLVDIEKGQNLGLDAAFFGDRQAIPPIHSPVDTHRLDPYEINRGEGAYEIGRS